MPILAIFLRQLIMALVTAIPLTIAQEIFDGTIRRLVEAIRDEEGLTIEEAKDIVSNILIDLGINTATIFTVVRGKIGVKVAEFLGLTSKGFAKKTLTTKATATVAKLASTSGTAIGKSIIKKVLTGFGLLAGFIWLFKAMADIIEPGIYQPVQANKVYEKLGIPFQFPTPIAQLKPGPFNKDNFNDYAKAVEAAGVIGIEYGFPIGSALYNRQTLADLIDYVYGQEVIKGNAPTAQKIIPLLAPYLRTRDGTASSISAGIKTMTSLTAIPQVKVFTGIVSQGTLGAPTEFTPRENDLIESVDELKDSAQNNLAPFITALPGKIIYEIKIVSSVQTKDGFRRTGEAQKVLSKYTAAGVPLYKTVVNKFAVLDIFIMTDKLSKAKISSIVLGPTDAVKLQPKTNELKNIETSIKQDLFTSNISDITGIQTAQPITITAPPIQPAETIIMPTPVISTPQKIQLDDSFFNSRDTFFGEIYRIKNDTLLIYEPSRDQLTETEKRQAGNFGAQSALAVEKLKAKGIDVTALRREPFISDIVHKYIDRRKNVRFDEFFDPAVATPTPMSAKPAGSTCSLQTLFEWYSAQGQSLPSVSLRSTLYEQLGLGLASYYVGTSEQNTKLLASLKRNNGCNI